MNWDHAIKAITPHIVKIETPGGYGTGFLAFYNHDKTWCGIATAAHVVSHADNWQEPIKISHADSGSPLFLAQDQRVIVLDHITDSAIVFFFKGTLRLPEGPPTLLPMGQPLGIGRDVGWLGYPAIEPFSLCFFAGTVSAHLRSRKAYLIDGVAINGVSGGPVFHCTGSGEAQIIGSVTAYHANRVTDGTPPGLLKAQDVSHFHVVAESMRSIDEADDKKKEFEEAHKATDQPTTPQASEAEVTDGLQCPVSMNLKLTHPRLRTYGTSSEYVRELIRKDQQRAQLRNILLAGATSAPAAPVNREYFDNLRRKATAAKFAARR